MTNLFNRVDLQLLNCAEKLSTVAAVASEHGFRGLLVLPSQIEQVAKVVQETKSNIIPIVFLDFPLGLSNQDTRIFSIISAKEKGAQEVEIIVAAYHIVNIDFDAFYEDVKNIKETCERLEIGYKIVFEKEILEIDISVKKELYNIFKMNKVPWINTSSGYYEQTESHDDKIINCTEIKKYCGCQVKTFLDTNDFRKLSKYFNSGIDVVGLDWSKAPNLVHKCQTTGV